MQQVSVFIENTSGTLTDVLKSIKNAGIQLYAISIADTSEYGICRIICDDPQKAFDTLRASGFAASVSEVIALSIGDAPGDASDSISLFAEAGVSIAYLYSFLLNGKPVLAFRTDDKEKAMNIVEKNGLTIAEL